MALKIKLEMKGGPGASMAKACEDITLDSIVDIIVDLTNNIERQINITSGMIEAQQSIISNLCNENEILKERIAHLEDYIAIPPCRRYKKKV